MRLLIIVFAILFILFQYSLWFGPGGIRDKHLLKQEITLQQQRNQTLAAHNQILVDKIKQVKQKQPATEQLAREQLGMIKKGETYYQFVPQTKSGGKTSKS